MAKRDKKAGNAIIFSVDAEGLFQLIEKFQFFWIVLEEIVRGSAVSTHEMNNFTGRKKTFLRHSVGILENIPEEEGQEDPTPKDTYKHTVGYGAVLMREIEKYIEDLIDSARVKEVFDRACEEFRESSQAIFKENEERLSGAYTRFTIENEKDDSERNLSRVVPAYNELVRVIDSVKAEVTREESERREREEARKKHLRLQTVRRKGLELVSRLSA